MSVFWLYTFRKKEVKPQGESDSRWRGVEKRCRALTLKNPYRKPTQVGGHKCAKVYERTLVKELGKKACVTSG